MGFMDILDNAQQVNNMAANNRTGGPQQKNPQQQQAQGADPVTGLIQKILSGKAPVAEAAQPASVGAGAGGAGFSDLAPIIAAAGVV